VCWVLLIEGIQDQSSAMSTCTGSLGGMVVSACPTAGLVGCCRSTTVTPSTDECFYTGTQSSQANFCGVGTWTTTIP
jgi:ammonia channel protein AmtB